jgi:polyhydroxybutyrate depolymerase
MKTSNNTTMNKPVTLLLAVLCGVAAVDTKAMAQTSEANPSLREALKHHPAADANGDGVLTLEEAKAFGRKAQAQKVDAPGGKVEVEDKAATVINEKSTRPTGAEPVRWTWNIDGTKRQALVYIPAASTGLAPVVFAFHGHGGTMQSSAERLGIHRLWPEAVVIYPQGLPTPGRNHDPQGKKPGWNPAWKESNRDLKFFDAMFALLSKKLKIDPKRVYVEGSSNGTGLTCLIWAARPDSVAAVGIICGGAADEKVRNALKPRPVFHVAGLTDKTVPFALQKQMIDFYIKLNGCDTKGKGTSTIVGLAEYPSAIGAPVETFIHDGGHGIPQTAPKPLVEFFKRIDATKRQ